MTLTPRDPPVRRRAPVARRRRCTTGQRSVLLLSDGNDNAGHRRSPTVIASAKNAGRPHRRRRRSTRSSPRDSPLSADRGRRPAARSPPRRTSTSFEALFAAEADDLAKQLVVTFDPPADLDSSEGTLGGLRRRRRHAVRRQRVRHARPSGGELPPSPTYAAGRPRRSALSGPWLLAGIVLLFGGLAVLLPSARPRSAPKAATPMQQQLSLYTVHGMRRAEPAAPTRRGRRPQGDRGRRSPTTWSMRATSRTRSPSKLDARRAQAEAGRVAAAARRHRHRLRRSSAVLLFGAESIFIGPVPARSERSCRGSTSRSRRRAGSRSSTAAGRDAPDHRRAVSRPVCRCSQAVDTVVQEGSEPIAQRVPPRDHRAAARRRDRGLARDRRRADGERRLQVGRDGDPHPARGRRQPGRAAAQRRRRPCASASTCAARSPCSAPRVGCRPGSSAACRRSSSCYLIADPADLHRARCSTPDSAG